ncbi:MAG: hypothetical protein J1F40_10855 [Prevotellaceae bacterium]|nr:hypothetical protein [Prevotellaceae bacterium]
MLNTRQNRKEKRMTGDAKTILLFTEQRTAISHLADEQAGQLFKSLYAYADEGALPDFEGAMMSVFTMLQSQIDRSAEAYREKCERNRANAQKRYAARPANTSTSDCARMPPHTKNCDCMPSHPVACLPNPSSNPNSNPNPHIDDGADTHIINDMEVVVEEEHPFDEIWEMYGKPVGDAEQLRQRWQELSLGEKKKIFEYVPLYVQARPDRKYRKDFANFLTCRTWENEPINPDTLNNGNVNQFCHQPNERKRLVAVSGAEELVSKLIAESTGHAAVNGGSEE